MFKWLLALLFLLQVVPMQAQTSSPRKKRLVLITGCSRSGTLYMTKFLQMNGVQIAHENDAPHGTVSWCMAVDADETPWGPGANLFKYTHTFHQVRHPLKAIASISNEPQKAWKFIAKHVPQLKIADPPLVKAAYYWVYWNLLAEKKADFTYRLEDLPKVLPALSAALKITLDPSLLSQVPKDFYNNRNYQTSCTWQDLKAVLDPAFYNKLVKLAKHYGYTTEDP